MDPDDPTEISGIIDWESAPVEPAFVFAAELPDNHALRQIFDREEGQDSAYAGLRGDVDFDAKTWSLVPMICDKLREASQLDTSVIQLLAATRNGWLTDEDCLGPVPSAITRKWTNLDLPGQSNYLETPAETRALRVRLDKTSATQRLRGYLLRRLGSDSDE